MQLPKIIIKDAGVIVNNTRAIGRITATTATNPDGSNPKADTNWGDGSTTIQDDPTVFYGDAKGRDIQLVRTTGTRF